MAIGGAIGAAIGAVSSIATQYRTTGSVNWKSVGVAAAAGFVSGVIAASPLKLQGQKIAGGIIGGLSYVADCYVNDRAMKLDELVLSVGLGVLSGRISGDGANLDLVINETCYLANSVICKNNRRTNQAYASKSNMCVLEYRNNMFSYIGWTSSMKFAAGVGAANGLMEGYRQLNLFPNMPSWKPW